MGQQTDDAIGGGDVHRDDLLQGGQGVAAVDHDDGGHVGGVGRVDL